MRIKYVIPCLLSFISLNILAQETKFNFTKVSEQKTPSIPYNFSACNIDGQYLLGSIYESKVDLFDSNINLIRSKEIFKKEGNEKKLGVWKYLFFSNNINVFTINTHSKKDTNILLVKKIKEDLSEESEWEKLCDIPYEKTREIAGYKISNSQDGSKVLFNTGVPPRLFKSIAGFGLSDIKSTMVSCHVYDSKFKPIWSKSIKLGDDNREYDLSNFQVSNDAKVIFIGKTNVEKQEKTKFLTDHKYVLFVYDYELDKLNHYDIKLENKYITHISYIIDNNHKKIFVSGYYSNKSLKNIIGTYIKKLDLETNNFEIESSTKFDDNFLLKYLSQNKIQKNK